MTLREYAAVVSAILVIGGTTWYIYLALWKGVVKPVLAAWIVNSLAIVLSLVTYWTSSKHSFVGGLYNGTSSITITSILVASIILTRREGKGLRFSPLQIKYLWTTLSITILWIVLVWVFHGDGTIPNLATQVMMCIGYVVIGQRLWSATEKSESSISWLCITLASTAGMVTALMGHDWLAAAFAGRTFVGSLILTLLTLRIDIRIRQQNNALGKMHV